MLRFLILPAMAIAVGVCVTAGSSTPAAAKSCLYKIVHKSGRVVEDTAKRGYSVSQKTACNRARQKCNNNLERARKKGQLPRGGPRDFRCERVA